MGCLPLQIQEFSQRGPHFILRCFRDLAKIVSKEIVVPGQDLVGHDVRIFLKTARAGGNRHAKWVRVGHGPGRERQDDGAW